MSRQGVRLAPRREKMVSVGGTDKPEQRQNANMEKMAAIGRLVSGAGRQLVGKPFHIQDLADAVDSLLSRSR